ncbi:phage virion morphogenesis protein [Flavobacterium sp. F-65]|uniref:Phage virion morphogenesis protein n=1 Tax=Flavobacterium pisciphilum TaxID=2893755 RepID=A0ABS8MUK1_9FLAO|nr:phage virion morphogenesis protein [Flavobacterium sp. F-65]MCC9072466.1 phage virion morphogenesis protein [Flavobacterium sp. F-65]
MQDFIVKLNRLSKLYKRFPEMAAIEAVNFSKERFVRKNWVDKSVSRWKPRKPSPEWHTDAQKKAAARGSLMVKSGRLKRSIRKIKVTRNSVTIGTDVPYAEVHNEGAVINQTITVKTHSRKRKGRTETVKAHRRKRKMTIPERRFIGESALLLRRIERLVQKEINEILK